MQVPLRILMIEDSESDAMLLVRHLTRGGYKVNWDRVDNDPQVGSAGEGEADASSPSRAGFRGTETILLADDHAALAEIATALLSMHGYTFVGDVPIRVHPR